MTADTLLPVRAGKPSNTSMQETAPRAAAGAANVTPPEASAAVVLSVSGYEALLDETAMLRDVHDAKSEIERGRAALAGGRAGQR